MQSRSIRSEKGMALITVLLLLAVVSALTTTLAMSGQTEIAMASNEMYYAGARAAAEAGLNRATEHLNDIPTLNLLAGADNNPAATADNGRVPTIGNGPFTLTAQYTYTLQILDDDDPSLYTTPLSAAQLTQMGEQSPTADPNVSGNDRLILRAVGLGPRNTRVIVQRILESVSVNNTTTTNVPRTSNPALLVDGALSIGGSVDIFGNPAKFGSVHANGNIVGNVSGGGGITGDITSTGTIDDRLDPDGMKAGNIAPVQVPEVRAADFKNLADWILKADGTMFNVALNTTCAAACGISGWSYDSSTGGWNASGGMPTAATYYVEGPVQIHGTGSSGLTSLSVIAEGSISITGNGRFRPANASKIQFVTNGDFKSNADANDPTDVDGQIMVREQLKLQGGFDFQGRIVVKNKDSASNVYNATTNPHGRRGANIEDANDVNGTVSIEYNGRLPGIEYVETIVTPLPTTYTNNVSGWMEQ
jgi:Tfp pilus assembly protein PilX